MSSFTGRRILRPVRVLAVYLAAFGMMAVSIVTTGATPATAATTGQLWGWGADYAGSLGDGSSQSQQGAEAIAPLNDVVKLARNETGFAVRADHTLWAWGQAVGQWAGGQPSSSNTKPTRVPHLTNVVDVGDTWNHDGRYYAVRSDGTLWWWGSKTGGKAPYYGPAKVAGVSKVKSLVSNDYSVLALRTDGTVYQWAEFPFPAHPEHKWPALVPHLTQVTKVFIAGWCYFATRKDGSVWAWGDNDKYKTNLADGTTKPRLTPVPVANLRHVIDVTTGFDWTYGIRSDGSVLAWGNGHHTPHRVAGLSGIQEIASGQDAAYARKKDGSVWAWGSNRYGELGIGRTDSTQHKTPVKLTRLSNVRQLGADFEYALALRTDGTVWSWGSDVNTYFNRSSNTGALGLCGTRQTPTPTQVTGVANGTQLLTTGWSTWVVGGQGSGSSCSS